MMPDVVRQIHRGHSTAAQFAVDLVPLDEQVPQGFELAAHSDNLVQLRFLARADVHVA